MKCSLFYALIFTTTLNSKAQHQFSVISDAGISKIKQCSNSKRFVFVLTRNSLAHVPFGLNGKLPNLDYGLNVPINYKITEKLILHTKYYYGLKNNGSNQTEYLLSNV